MFLPYDYRNKDLRGYEIREIQVSEQGDDLLIYYDYYITLSNCNKCYVFYYNRINVH